MASAESRQPDASLRSPPAHKLLDRLPTPKKHWGPRYVLSRLELMIHERLHPDEPWITAEMTSFLDQYLRPSDLLVEFGSGRSTVWFAQRVARVISVEDNPQWHKAVSERLRAGGVSNVDYVLAAREPDTYARAPEPFIQAPVDVVLVDGAHRDACTLWAMDQLRPGGLLVIDNVNWYLPKATHSPSSVGPCGQVPSPAWQRAHERLKTWRSIWTSNNVTDTAAYFAPCEQPATS